jgi:hypothetical protein
VTAGESSGYAPYSDARSWYNALDWLEDVFQPSQVDVLPQDQSVWEYGVTADNIVTSDLEYACGDAMCTALLVTSSGASLYPSHLTRPAV